ncbi:heat shock factor-binding protein 1 [Sipha flava]|uniref:Heat shock factor-binding protein 1 n=1 Tax=Sipha flava TaxID=143950 RepID=A0A8B8GG03_9HEMI|nr:heat shock factor-binding protein 1 [Sipha flava]
MCDFNVKEENTSEMSEIKTEGDVDPKALDDMNQHIQNVLQQMRDKFQTMSEQILTKIDDMGTRIDDLEKNITDLMNHAGLETPDK